MMFRKVTTKPSTRSISDDELLSRLANAYRRFTESRDQGKVSRAAAAYKSYGIYREEALRRMKRSDPILRGADG